VIVTVSVIRVFNVRCTFSMLLKYTVADELLISDMLAEELEIAVESFGRGLWRFRWEQKLRKSEKR